MEARVRVVGTMGGVHGGGGGPQCFQQTGINWNVQFVALHEER
jgi:hypothetical protein